MDLRKIDLSDIQRQFQNLDARDMGNWPRLPKATVLVVLAGLIIAAGWYFYWQPIGLELDTKRAEEQTLRQQYLDKAQQSVNLEELKRQREEVAQFVTALEKQLPSRAEMDALLSDINQAGIGRGLQFVLFKPGQVTLRDHYAELPITIQLTGRYHDFGTFAADIAALPRIVNLGDIAIQTDARSGAQTLATTAKTFRYLDAEEKAAQQAQARQPQRKNP